MASSQKHEVRMFPSPVSFDFAWLYTQGANPDDYGRYARAACVAIMGKTALKPRNAGAGPSDGLISELSAHKARNP